MGNKEGYVVMSFYFNKFPNIEYSNNVCVNIFTRPSLTNSAKSETSVYYPYTLKDGERADHLANHYYEDASYSWLLYFCNDIVDPYYEWYLSDEEFNDKMVKKYGSLEKSKQKILYYQVAWYNNESFLSEAGYSALTPQLKKYWTPLLTENGRVRGYERARINWVVETNFIQQLHYTPDVEPVVDEIITQTNSNNVVVATGTVAHIDTSNRVVSVQHVSGEFITTLNARGETANIEIDSIGERYYNIPLDELVYWEPQYAYDVEDSINQARRTVYVMDRSYIPQVEKELESLFNG